MCTPRRLGRSVPTHSAYTTCWAMPGSGSTTVITIATTEPHSMAPRGGAVAIANTALSVAAPGSAFQFAFARRYDTGITRRIGAPMSASGSPERSLRLERLLRPAVGFQEVGKWPAPDFINIQRLTRVC